MGTMSWTLGNALDCLGLHWRCFMPLSSENQCVPPPSALVGTEAPSDDARLEGFQQKGVLLGNNRELFKKKAEVLGRSLYIQFFCLFSYCKTKDISVFRN